jgi:hypothetical protein
LKISKIAKAGSTGVKVEHLRNFLNFVMSFSIVRGSLLFSRFGARLGLMDGSLRSFSGESARLFHACLRDFGGAQAPSMSAP